jgi:PAS domain S-box-containing protein
MEDSGVVLLDFRELLEAAPDGIAVVDERGRILAVNEQLCALFGYDRDELAGKEVEVLVPGRLRDLHVQSRQRYRSSPSRRPMGLGLDLVGLRKDGTEFPVEISLSPLTSGRRTFTIAIVRDVSERVRLLAKQRELQEAIAGGREWPVLASILLEAAPIGCLVVNREAEILMANAEIENLFGRARQDLIGRKVDILVPERLRAAHISGLETYFSDPRVRQEMNGRNVVGLRSDGTEFPLEVSLSPLETKNGLFVIALVRDITERHRLEEEQRLLQSLLDTQQERYRIGMDLHDGIMQDIYAVTLTLGMAAQDIDADAEGAKQEIRNSVEQLQSVIRDIRSYIFDLRPRQFSGDLGQALHELAREFQQNSSIPTVVQICDAMPNVEADIGVALYMIAHEALSNARKHANAKRVTISLNVDEGWLHLRVRDDGDGFDPSKEMPQSHHGLRNMASRTGLVRGEFRITSTQGEGAEVNVRVPLT